MSSTLIRLLKNAYLPTLGNQKELYTLRHHGALVVKIAPDAKLELTCSCIPDEQLL